MDRRVKIVMILVKTLVLLGLGTAGIIHELFFVQNSNIEIILICWGFITVEGGVNAWLLNGKELITERPSQPQE